MYGQTVLYLTGTGTYPNFARYSGVSASIWGTVPDSTKGDSCESAIKKNQRASDARKGCRVYTQVRTWVHVICMGKQCCTRGYKGTYPNFPRYHFGPPLSGWGAATLQFCIVL